MMPADLRTFLRELEEQKKLIHIRKRVRSEYEISALLRHTDGKLPLYFEKVDDYACPLVAGLGGTRELLAAGMGAEPRELARKLADAIVRPIPAQKVERAPVQENVVSAPFDLSRYFPILKYNEKDSGRFMLSGVMVARDLSGRHLYTSIRRMQYLGKNRSNILITSYEMQRQFQYYERKKEPMDIAVMFGVHPAVVLGSQVSTHAYHVNKLDVTGALLGGPMPVVHCKTGDLDVLADAEIVLEGKVKPWIKCKEGPFGELGGYYGQVSEQPVVEFTALTYRNHPIAQTILAGSCEEKLPEAVSREVALFSAVSQAVPSVTAVNVTMAGVARFHAVIQLRKQADSDARQALLAAFSADKDLKHVVAVDTDVDLFDPAEVEWAIATRMQADTDIFIVPGAAGSPLEPSHNLRGVTAKMGIDATAPLGHPEYERVKIPGYENIRLADYLG